MVLTSGGWRMQLFSSFGISFLHFSALTVWQFNFAFSVLRYYISVFSILKNANRCYSLCAILEMQNIWTATTTQGSAGSSHHLSEVPLGKVFSSTFALSGMGQVISKLFLTRPNIFRDKKGEKMETISTVWDSFPNLTKNLCMGLAATPFPLRLYHFWTLQKQGFA